MGTFGECRDELPAIGEAVKPLLSSIGEAATMAALALLSGVAGEYGGGGEGIAARIASCQPEAGKGSPDVRPTVVAEIGRFLVIEVHTNCAEPYPAIEKLRTYLPVRSAVLCSPAWCCASAGTPFATPTPAPCSIAVDCTVPCLVI